MVDGVNTTAPRADDGALVTHTKGVETMRWRLDLYYLFSGDNPGAIISKLFLRGSNYDEWSVNLHGALKARKKFGFVDGTIPQPDDGSEDLEDWWANNAMVVSWIKLTVDPSLCTSLTHHEVAHNLWLHIQKRFSVRNNQGVQRLKAELAICRLKGLPIETYYGKLNQLCTNLADYQRAKTMEEVLKERKEDKVHQFLMGLDESLFVAGKSSLFSRDPLLSWDESYNVLTQDEESKISSRILEELHEGVSFAVQAAPLQKQSDSRLVNANGMCTICGRKCHLAEFFFRKSGYPPWYKGERHQPSLNSQQYQGNTSDTRSLNPIVPPRGSEIARANLVSTPSSALAASYATTSTLTNADRIGFSGLNDSQ